MIVLEETVKLEVSNALLLPSETYIYGCVDELCASKFKSKVESFSYLHEGNDSWMIMHGLIVC